MSDPTVVKTTNLELTKVDQKMSLEAIAAAYNGNLDILDKAVDDARQGVANAEELAQKAKEIAEDITEKVDDQQDKLDELEKKNEAVLALAEELKKTQEQMAALAAQVEEVTSVLHTFRSAFVAPAT